MSSEPWQFFHGSGPIVAASIHSGSLTRSSISEHLAIEGHERLREEDPFTDTWTHIVSNRIVGHHSRFEFDLNRPRDRAVYLEPEHAWGLQVWKSGLPGELIAESLATYDRFYGEAEDYFGQLVTRYDRIVVLDLHSYNHRRNGPEAEPDCPTVNPEVNIGTGTMPRSRWAQIVDRFMADLSQFDFLGRSLDVRENARFRGGNFAAWLHQRFPENVCVLSVEFKKFFMNEWTGEKLDEEVAAIGSALKSTVAGILHELEK